MDCLELLASTLASAGPEVAAIVYPALHHLPSRTDPDRDITWRVARVAFAIGSPQAKCPPDLAEVRARVADVLALEIVKTQRYVRIGDSTWTRYVVVAVLPVERGDEALLFPAPPAGSSYAFDTTVPRGNHHRLGAADAEDIVHEAIEQFIRAGGVADPADRGALLQALGSRINGIVVNQRRKKALRAVGPTADGAPAELEDPPDPEMTLVEGAAVRKAVGLLLDRTAGDELACAIVLEMAEGMDEPAELAKVLGRDVGEVYNARRRLKPHIEAVNKIKEGW